jgi:tetratricopeptide (TPR) repeat protein
LQFQYQFVAGNILFWSLAAVVASETGRSSTGVMIKPRTARFGSSGIFKWGATTAVVATALFTGSWCARFLNADIYFLQFLEARNKNQFVGALEVYRYIKDELPFPTYYDEQAALILAGWSEEMQPRLFRALGENKLTLAIANLETDTPSVLYARAMGTASLSTSTDPSAPEKAENAFRRLIEVAPNVPKYRNGYGKFLLNSGRAAEAAAEYQAALDRLPDLADTRLNAYYRGSVLKNMIPALIGRGEALLVLGEAGMARERFSEARALTGDSVYTINTIMGAEYRQGDLAGALGSAEYGRRVDPTNAYWPYNIARLFRELGESDKALTAARDALGLAPNDRNNQILVWEIENGVPSDKSALH